MKISAFTILMMLSCFEITGLTYMKLMVILNFAGHMSALKSPTRQYALYVSTAVQC